MKRVIPTIVATLVLCYAAICIGLFFFQRSLIYFPQQRTGYPGTEILKLETNDAVLNVTVLKRNGDRALLYFGGNAEDVSLSAPALAKAFPGRSLYLLHYRSYGGSTGKPSEKALVSDGIALFDLANRDHKDVVVAGRSLGSGVAMQVASQRPASRLVLVTPYDSIQELAAQQFSYFPVRWLLQDKFESWKYAGAIRVPTIVIAAENDEVIPRESTERLLAHFSRHLVQYKIIRNAGHNSIGEFPEYVQLLAGPT